MCQQEPGRRQFVILPDQWKKSGVLNIDFIKRGKWKQDNHFSRYFVVLSSSECTTVAQTTLVKLEGCVIRLAVCIEVCADVYSRTLVTTTLVPMSSGNLPGQLVKTSITLDHGCRFGDHDDRSFLVNTVWFCLGDQISADDLPGDQKCHEKKKVTQKIFSGAKLLEIAGTIPFLQERTVLTTWMSDPENPKIFVIDMSREALTDITY